VDAGAFERAFGINATPLEEALTATVAWYHARSREPRKGHGDSVARALSVFALDNLLIGLAVLAIRFLVGSVPALSVVEMGIAVAAGLYWLPLARRGSIALVRRMRTQPSLSSPPKRARHDVFEGSSTKVSSSLAASMPSTPPLRLSTNA
jgi:hypothetical protein